MKSSFLLIPALLLTLVGCDFNLLDGLNDYKEDPALGGIPDDCEVTNLSLTPGNSRITAVWLAGTGLKSCDMYWSTSSDVSKTNGTKIAGVKSPYVLTGLSNGVVYYFLVAGTMPGGETGPIAEGHNAPSATPSQALHITPASSQNTISWQTLWGATSYNLYWSTTPGVTTTSGTKIADVTSPYIHTGLTNGETYYYILTVANANGETPVFDEASALVP